MQTTTDNTKKKQKTKIKQKNIKKGRQHSEIGKISDEYFISKFSCKKKLINSLKVNTQWEN